MGGIPPHCKDSPCTCSALHQLALAGTFSRKARTLKQGMHACGCCTTKPNPIAGPARTWMMADRARKATCSGTATSAATSRMQPLPGAILPPRPALQQWWRSTISSTLSRRDIALLVCTQTIISYRSSVKMASLCRQRCLAAR